MKRPIEIKIKQKPTCTSVDEEGGPAFPKAALILNPVGMELTSTNPKLTAAGLIGRVMSKGGKTLSEPGQLPSNSGGVVCLQEFHDEREKKREELFGIFSRFMEEGAVFETTSAKTEHVAETALHVDMNRYSMDGLQDAEGVD